jgi:transposase
VRSVTATTATLQLDEVRALLASLHEKGEHEQVLEVALRLLDQVVRDNQDLSRQLARALTRAAGNRSEKIDPQQLWLWVTQALAMEEKPAPPPPARPPERERPRPAAPSGRKPLPAHLPREVRRIAVAPENQTCACGKPTKLIGVETSEVLELTPARFMVITYERERRGCPDGQCGVVVAPVADKVIEKGLPGPGLLADVLVGKYGDHLPLHRQTGIYARQGVELAPSTLGDWVREGVEILEPVAQAIMAEVLAAHVVQADDTGLRVLDGEAPGGSKKGHLWGFVGDRKLVAFQYTETWKGEEARRHVAGRRGWLQVDGYAGFDKLFKAAEPVVFEVGCWSHARRKYVEALDAGDVRAAVGIAIIGKLFEVEREADAGGLAHDARRALRAQRSAATLDELQQWVAETRSRAPPKSPLGQALGYTVNQWRQLRRFLEDGRLELTNNGVERALRAIAVGRANWLFAGSDTGARRAAVMYTVIGTCKLCGVDPLAYLRDVFEKLSQGWPNKRLAELLPHRWTTPSAA